MLIQDAIRALEAQRGNAYIRCAETASQDLRLIMIEGRLRLVGHTYHTPNLYMDDLLSDGWEMYSDTDQLSKL